MAIPSSLRSVMGSSRWTVALCVSALITFVVFASARAAEVDVRTTQDLAYKSGPALSEYEQTRCKLDLHVPVQASNAPVLVWFHGGAIKEGSKDEKNTRAIVRRLASDGLAVAAVNYRLSPEATYPAYLDDAAAAVAWVHRHASEHQLDSKRVFVGGHSAGGYLAAMVGIDPRWLRAHGAETDVIAGLVPISGQMMTHYTIREERGIKNPRTTLIADDAAPIYHAASNTPPWLVFFADKDMPTRSEENAFFVSVLRASGNKRVESMRVANRTHGSIAEKIAEANDPVAEAILRFTRSVEALKR